MSKRQKISEDRYVETDVLENFKDESEEIRKLVQAQNRKKKSGGFQSMGLSPNVFRGVMRKGYKVPTPVQRKTIPHLLEGKDVVAMARTGSGKTAAFLIPLFEKLKTPSTAGIRALLLSPTRELAIQTQKFTKEIGRFMKLKSAVMVGGSRIEDDFAAMHASLDILIATPGRLMQILVEMETEKSTSPLSRVEYVVIDEADRLFEMGFQEQMNEILRRMPASRQTMLFSATLPKLLLEFAHAGLHNPLLIKLDVDKKLSQDLKSSFLMCRSDDRTALLLHLLRHVVKPDELTVVFVATTHQVEYIRSIVMDAGIDCSYIYSALDQTCRLTNVEKFRNKRTSLLIATDAVARGIDIPHLDNVINYNFPDKPKLFLHRVGRVARAGRSGNAYSLVCPDDVAYVIDLHIFLGNQIKFMQMGASTEDDGGLCGRVPQAVIEDQTGLLKTIHEKLDIQNIFKTAQNAFEKYCRTREKPSTESVRRAKEMASIVVGYHPVFGNRSTNLEVQHDQMLEAIKHYKPRETVVSKQQASLPKLPGFKKVAAAKSGNPKSSDAGFNAAGPLVVDVKPKGSSAGSTADIFKEDWMTGEETLSVWNTDANSFEIGSTQEQNKGSKNRMVWSRKKKKFVHVNELQKPEKKMKMKPNLYKKWLNKNKFENAEDVDGERFGQKKTFNRRGGERQFRYQKEKGGKGSGGQSKPQAKDRLKPKEQILKERRVKAQKQAFETHQRQKKQKNRNRKKD